MFYCYYNIYTAMLGYRNSIISSIVYSQNRMWTVMILDGMFKGVKYVSYRFELRILWYHIYYKNSLKCMYLKCIFFIAWRYDWSEWHIGICIHKYLKDISIPKHYTHFTGNTLPLCAFGKETCFVFLFL